LAEILNFQGSAHLIGVGSLSYNISGKNEKPGFLFTKWDFRLQTGNLVYKTGFSFTN
jgi:hypothetical protein